MLCLPLGQLHSEIHLEEPAMRGMRELVDVCQQLGVGASGTLNQAEFKKVFAYIGMGNIRDRVSQCSVYSGCFLNST